jgi:hypothetical protein
MNVAIGERDYRGVFAKPLPIVVETLRRCATWDAFAEALPDLGEAEVLPNSADDDWIKS